MLYIAKDTTDSHTPSSCYKSIATRNQETISRDKKMQVNLILVTTAVILALAIFIPTSDARHIPSRFNRRDQESVASNSESVCGSCPDGSNFSYVYILRGNDSHKSYMFVDLLLPNGCCDVIAKDVSNPLDIQGNMLNNYTCIQNYRHLATCNYNSYFI